MNVIEYTLLAYGLTAVISFAVIGVIVFINKLLSENGSNKEV